MPHSAVFREPADSGWTLWIAAHRGTQGNLGVLQTFGLSLSRQTSGKKRQQSKNMSCFIICSTRALTYIGNNNILLKWTAEISRLSSCQLGSISHRKVTQKLSFLLHVGLFGTLTEKAIVSLFTAIGSYSSSYQKCFCSTFVLFASCHCFQEVWAFR